LKSPIIKAEITKFNDIKINKNTIKSKQQREMIQTESKIFLQKERKRKRGSSKITETKQRQNQRTHTPPATPPATSDLQMLRTAWPGAFTPSLASFASSARFTIVDTADSLVVFPTTSSDAIAETLGFRGQNAPVDRFSRDLATSFSSESEFPCPYGHALREMAALMFSLVRKEKREKKKKEYIFFFRRALNIYEQ
jgi:hypothetical protein